MERLVARLLYCDTDSCIFVVKNGNDPDEYEPPVGHFLGEMTDELAWYGSGTYIDTLMSGAPKSYAFRAITPSGEIMECCKVRRITLNYRNSLKVNFKSIKNLVDTFIFPDYTDAEDMETDDREIKLNFSAIHYTPRQELVTRNEFKTCSVVLKKRRYVSKRLSLPFGYKSSFGQ